jgi:hypothetical protein
MSEENRIVDPHVKACCAVWKSDFYRLRPYAGIYPVYLSLMGMARSTYELDKLYLALPCSNRLLRRDWIEFRKFWQRYFTGNDANRCRRQLQLWLLEEASAWAVSKNEGLCNVNYYLDMVIKGACEKPPEHFAGGEDGKGEYGRKFRILSCAERCGKGDSHFYADIFDILTRVVLKMDEDMVHMLVQLNFRHEDITEKISHMLLDQLPSYYLFKYSPGSLAGHIGLSFELNASGLAKQLKIHESAPLRDMIALPEFLMSAANLMRKHGIPVEGRLIPMHA